MKIILSILVLSFTFQAFAQNPDDLVIAPVSLDPVRPAKYARSYQDLNGDVHVMGLFKVSQQEDGQLVTRAQYEPVFPPASLNEAIMNAFYSRPGFFIALNNKVKHVEGTIYTVKMWQSDDDLKTIRETEAKVILPEAGKVDFGEPGEWAGLVCHRAIIQLDDGSLLAAMYGNFENDTIIPTNTQSKSETKFKLRAFVVSSNDHGQTWRYRSSVAVPDHNQPDSSEGFNEWSMVQLDDGRILAAIRTGHFTPLVLSYSADQGRTWSTPVSNPELGPAGCDPYLLKLKDGRIALAYGEMVQPTVSDDQYFANFLEKGDHRRRCRLAISTSPKADHWQSYNITGYGSRSAYPTIFQIQTNLILYQADLEIYEIHVPFKL